MPNSKFQFRGFISILLSLAFVIVVVTGLVLWLSHSPQTFGIGKGVWKHTHIFLSLLMLIAGAIHFWLNWPVFCSYLWQKATGRLNQKRELALAVAIVALITIPGLFHDGPGDLQRLGAMNLQQVAQRSGKPVDQIVSVLKQEGIDVHNPADSLLEIAQHNNSAPDALLAVLYRTMPEAMPPMRGEH
jgi:hypothetical protein